MMNMAKRCCLVLTVLLIIVLTVQPVSAYDWNAGTGFTFEYQTTNYYCGPASSRMYLTFAKSKYGFANTIPDQANIYSNERSQNISSDPAVDPRGLAWGLYNNTPAGYYYADWIYDNANSGLKGSAWTIGYYLEPIVATVYGGTHFVVVRGVTADSDPASNYPNANITYVYIADPWNNTFGQVSGHSTIGQNVHMSAGTWTSSYFLKFNYHSENADWTNHWVTIERSYTSGTPTTHHGSSTGSSLITSNGKDATVPETITALSPNDPKYSPESNSSAELVLNNDIPAQIDLLEKETAEEAQRPEQIGGSDDVKTLINKVIKLIRLEEKPGFGTAIHGTKPGNPIFVKSISPDFPDYYLVPFLKDGGVTYVAQIGVEEGRGTYMGSTYSDLPVDNYLPITQPQVMALVEGNYPGSIVKSSELVWKPSRISTQPYFPFWKIEMSNQIVYVDQSGNFYNEVPLLGLGLNNP